jgi:hypothetical protein
MDKTGYVRHCKLLTLEALGLPRAACPEGLQDPATPSSRVGPCVLAQLSL